MPQDRHRIIPAVYMLLKRDEEVLLLRRFNTGYCDGMYSLPAGHLDGGETIIEAAIREAREEVGVEVYPEDIRLCHVMNRPNSDDGERVDFFFVTEKWTGEPGVMEPDKCDEVRWAHLDELGSVELISYVRQMFRCWREQVTYSDYCEGA